MDADTAKPEKPILSELAWRILRRLNDGAMTASQMAEEFMANDDAVQELVDAGFIKQRRFRLDN